jgi:hypothetical protein
MITKTMKVLAIAGLVAFLPSLASAWHGNLVRCNNTVPALEIPVKVTPGFMCTNILNKLSVKATVKDGTAMNGCVANSDAPWDEWAAAKIGAKTSAADAATIALAEITLKGLNYGTCDFAGDPDHSFNSSASGKVQFYDAGQVKVKTGKLSYFGGVVGLLSPSVAQIVGLVTKGLGVGGAILIQIPIDALNPVNAGIVQCNLHVACPQFGHDDPFLPPPDGGGPGTVLMLTTDTTNTFLSIDVVDNEDCTAAGVPYYCCTGNQTGRCPS